MPMSRGGEHLGGELGQPAAELAAERQAAHLAEHRHHRPGLRADLLGQPLHPRRATPAGPPGRTAASTWAGSRPPIRWPTSPSPRWRPPGTSVAGSSHSSASLTASRTAARCASVSDERGGRERCLAMLRGEVVVHRTAAGVLRLAEHLPELGEHLPQLAHVEPADGIPGIPGIPGMAPKPNGSCGSSRRSGRSRSSSRSPEPNPNGAHLMRPRYAADVRLTNVAYGFAGCAPGRRPCSWPGSLALGLAVLGASWLPVPLVALGPGPTYDTLGNVDGDAGHHRAGSADLPAVRAPEHDHGVGHRPPHARRRAAPVGGGRPPGRAALARSTRRA